MDSATFTYKYTAPDENGDIEIENITVFLNKNIVAAEFQNNTWHYHIKSDVVSEAAEIAYETLSNKGFQLRRGFRHLKGLSGNQNNSFDEGGSNVIFVS